MPQGRVLAEIMRPSVAPAAARSGDYRELASLYKQIEAPVGLVGTYTLQASTKALSSSASDDLTYRRIEAELAALNQRRDALAAQMLKLLDGAAFRGEKINSAVARGLEHQGEELIAQARALSGD